MNQANKALQIAVEELKKADPKTVSGHSGARLATVGSQDRIEIDFLGHRYLVCLPEVEVTCHDSTQEVSLREKIIILHYLLRSKGTMPSGRLIDLRELSGGIIYYPVFVARVHRPLIKVFGENFPLFLEAVSSLKGTQKDIADCAAEIPVFPRVPICFALYRGDEEFPPDCKVLFDANIVDHLPTEDVIVVCEETMRRLRSQISRSSGNN